MTEIKSEVSQVQTLASGFKGQSHSLSIIKDASSNYGGQEPASHIIDTMTETLPKIDDLMDKFGQCIESIAQKIEKVDQSHGG